MWHFNDPKTNYITNYVSNCVTKDYNRKSPNRYVVRMKNYKMSTKIIYHGEKLSDIKTEESDSHEQYYRKYKNALKS